MNTISLENKLLYCGLLNKNICKTPYNDINTLISMSGISIDKCIDNVFIINNVGVLVGNTLSSSLITSDLLRLRNFDNSLNKTRGYSVYSELRIPFVLQKKFHRSQKKNAFTFYEALLRRKYSVVMSAKGFFSSAEKIAGMTDINEFDAAWNTLLKQSKQIVIEEQQFGDPIKVFMKGKSVVAIYGIVSPFVIGDGKSTLRELTQKLNEERSHNILYKDILLQNSLIEELDMAEVPQEGQYVKVVDSLQIETGGVYIDLTTLLKDKFAYLVTHLSEILADNLYCNPPLFRAI